MTDIGDVCGDCGEELGPGASFCVACGTPRPLVGSEDPGGDAGAETATVPPWSRRVARGQTPPPPGVTAAPGTPPPGVAPPPPAGATVPLGVAPVGAAPSGAPADLPTAAGAPAGPPAAGGPTAPTPPDRGARPASRRGRGLALAAVVVVAVVAVGVGAALVLRSGSDEGSSDVAAATPEEPRPAEIQAGVAVIRDAPGLDGEKVRRVEEDAADGLEVLEELPEGGGWYRVRIGGDEGYMFGAFVMPPTAGHCVGRTEGKPDVVDAEGATVEAPPAGTRLLMTATEPTDGQWPVLLPDGSEGLVAVDGVKVVDCGS